MDIIQLLQQHEIEYTEVGKNVHKNHVNIKCPYCGEADPSKHLGIDLSTGKWACWRNNSHSGKKLAKLFAKLLRCSYSSAEEIVSESSGRSTADEIRSRLFPDLSQERKQSESRAVESDNRGLVPMINTSSRPSSLYYKFWQYLWTRKYNAFHSEMVARIYNLQVALTGRFANRIVFPVVREEKLIGNVGRCIDGGKLRYLSLPGQEVKRNLLFYDRIKKGGRVLLVVEGPFDAMRLDYAARSVSHYRIRVTSLFGISHSAEQIGLLYNIGGRFDDVRVMFDPEAYGPALALASELSGIGAKVLDISDVCGIDQDVADIPISKILQFFHHHFSK